MAWAITGSLDITRGNPVDQTLTIPLASATATVSDTSGNPVSVAARRSTLFARVVRQPTCCRAWRSPWSTRHPTCTRRGRPRNRTGELSSCRGRLHCVEDHSLGDTADLYSAENDFTTTGPISSDLTIPVTVSIVSGSLENASGAPLAGQIVTLDSPATGDAVAQASSNASGAFELTCRTWNVRPRYQWRHR